MKKALITGITRQDRNYLNPGLERERNEGMQELELAPENKI
jgi:hypothetical protein